MYWTLDGVYPRHKVLPDGIALNELFQRFRLSVDDIKCAIPGSSSRPDTLITPGLYCCTSHPCEGWVDSYCAPLRLIDLIGVYCYDYP